MAYISTYTGDGNTTAYTIPFGYIDSSHLVVTVGGVTKTLNTDFTLTSASTLTFGTAPLNGEAIKIERVTATNALVTYQQGALISADDLNTTNTQAVYVSEEAKGVSDAAKTASDAAVASANTSAATVSNNIVAIQAASGNAAAAAASEAAAATSETNAGNFASSASTSMTNAAVSRSAAETAKTAAETAKTAAETAKTAAETAETNAAASATSAASSASTATTQAATATTQATNAASSATTASGHAGVATTQASTASTQATNATTQANTATTKASEASASATSAAAAQTAAEAARDSALAAFDSFDDRYLGAKSSAPTVDNDGNALVSGALYYDTTASAMQVYTGSAWVAAYASLSGALLTTNNLSDLTNTTNARTNIGLGTGDTATFNQVNTATIDSNNAQLNLNSGTGRVQINSDNVSGTLQIKGSNNGTHSAPDIYLWNDSESPAAGDYLGRLDFWGEDTNDNAKLYGTIYSNITNATYGAISGTVKIGSSYNNLWYTAFSADEGVAKLYHLGNEKLEATANGIKTSTDGSSSAQLDIASGSTWSIRSNPTSGTNSYGLDFIKGSAGTDVKMALNSSGDLGLNVTPQVKMHVKGDTNQNVMIVDATGTSANYIFDVRDDGTSKFRVDPSGQVGIGTGSPDALTHIYSGASGVTNPQSYTKLHIESADHSAIQLSGNNTAEQWIWFADDTSSTPKGGLTYYHGNDYMGFRTNGAERMRLEHDGDLHVDGNVIAYSTTISDKRLKEDIKPIEGALDKVGQLSGYTFTYKADGKQSAGVIAQEVEAVLPSAVTESTLPLQTDDDVEYKTVQYDQLVGLLIESVKELKAEIEELKNGSSN